MNSSNNSFRDKLTNFSFVLPAVVIFSVFWIYPFFYTFFVSMHETDGISSSTFVGLKNFIDIFEDTDQTWWSSLSNGFYITLWALTFQNIIALMLALAADKVIRLKQFYRVVFFILPVLSEIIIGLLMQQFLSSDPPGRNVFNHLLEKLGLGFRDYKWLGPQKAIIVTALVHCWKGFGWAFVIFLAGLQSIPEQLYEAARIDGAGAWQSFCKITIPLLMPVLTLVIVLTILGTMQAFAMILALTRGVVIVPVMKIYNHLRLQFVGLACAEGLVLGIILVTVSFTMFFISKKIREKYGVLSN